jgi:hypothetical protein
MGAFIRVVLGMIASWLVGQAVGWLVRTAAEGTAQVLSDTPPPDARQTWREQKQIARQATIRAEIEDMQRLTED